MVLPTTEQALEQPTNVNIAGRVSDNPTPVARSEDTRLAQLRV